MRLDPLSRRDLPRRFIKIPASGNPRSVHRNQRSLKTVRRTVRALVELRLQIPVGPAHKRPPLPLPQHQQPHRRTLHTARRQLRRNLLPQQRRYRITHQPVQNAPRLLRPHQVVVDRTRRLQRLLDRLSRNLVKNHPPDRNFRLQHLKKMPADALPFPVLVRRQQNLIRPLQSRPQLGNNLLLVRRHHIQRLERILYLHAQPRPRLTLHLRRNLGRRGRQIPHVPHTGFDFISTRQKTANRSRLRRRLYND